MALEMSLLAISVLGILAGIFSNPLPFFGSTFFNIATVTLITSYQTLSNSVSAFPAIPSAIFVFAIAYFVGTFAVKILAAIPSPIQPFFIGLRGTA